MKILLFNLGTIEFRIMDWGIEGFKSLFEQDIILWGPIPNKKFIYRDKEIPILSVFESTTIKDIFNKLPEGWYPDIVACETSVLNYIPDIYLCPVKTILFTRDAWSDTIYNKKLVELFDFLNHAAIDRSLYKDYHVELMPLSNSAVSIPETGVRLSEFDNREIDVIAIANYDRSFYHERFKVFYKLSDLNRKGIKIKFVTGIKYAEINTYYQRSKIVIDWAHTLSNRSYEAAMNGCLLFSHKDNTLIKDYWVPWEEYIPYDEENLTELITYYLNNPDLSKKIIQKAQKKIQPVPPGWGQYVWENLELAYNTDISIQDRIKYVESLPPSVLYYRTATPLLFNYDYKTNYPPDWKELYFKRIDSALTYSAKRDEKIEPLIEAGRVAFIVKEAELSLKYLKELQQILPDYAWTYYSEGRIYFGNDEYGLALESLQKAIGCAQKAPELLQKYVLPFIEKGNTCDCRRITDYMWQSVYNHKNEFQITALLHLTFELSGNIYQRINEPNQAINSYIEAINYVPVMDCIYRVNPLLINSGEFQKIIEITTKGIENSPYDSILILYLAYALIQLGQKRKTFKLLNEHKKSLRSFVNVRKTFLIRVSINLILFFLIFGKYPDSKIIIELIKNLKNKLGFTYL
jgi:tetratricopeptide (TPR) repeat protein